MDASVASLNTGEMRNGEAVRNVNRRTFELREETMDRRQFMMAGAAVAVGVASGAVAEEGKGQAKTSSTPAALADPKKRELADAGAECVKAGDICMEHCLELLRQGDKNMVKCSETVAAMLPMSLRLPHSRRKVPRTSPSTPGPARRSVATAKPRARCTRATTTRAGGAWRRADVARGAPFELR